jgi:hypothetical protein
LQVLRRRQRITVFVTPRKGTIACLSLLRMHWRYAIQSIHDAVGNPLIDSEWFLFCIFSITSDTLNFIYHNPVSRWMPKQVLCKALLKTSSSSSRCTLFISSRLLSEY